MATCGMRAWMSWRQRSISVADGCSWLKVYRTDGAQEGTLQGAAFRDFVVRDIANYRKAVERGNLKAE